MAVKERVNLHIRWLIRRDYPVVLAIESAVFANPWTEDDFIRCLRQRNCIAIVAEHDDEVVGYVAYELNKSSIQIVNLAIAPEMQRRGVGTQLVRRLIGKLSAQRRSRLVLNVRETNLAAQQFLRFCGFRAIDVLCGYYDNTEEDAYLMEYWYTGDC